jgi:hypothetical protein
MAARRTPLRVRGDSSVADPSANGLVEARLTVGTHAILFVNPLLPDAGLEQAKYSRATR